MCIPWFPLDSSPLFIRFFAPPRAFLPSRGAPFPPPTSRSSGNNAARTRPSGDVKRTIGKPWENHRKMVVS